MYADIEETFETDSNKAGNLEDKEAALLKFFDADDKTKNDMKITIKNAQDAQANKSDYIKKANEAAKDKVCQYTNKAIQGINVDLKKIKEYDANIQKNYSQNEEWVNLLRNVENNPNFI